MYIDENTYGTFVRDLQTGVSLDLIEQDTKTHYRIDIYLKMVLSIVRENNKAVTDKDSIVNIVRNWFRQAYINPALNNLNYKVNITGNQSVTVKDLFLNRALTNYREYTLSTGKTTVVNRN